MSKRQSYVATQEIKVAVQGREAEVLDGLNIPWRDGRPHIRCPYPDHADERPSWRWDHKMARARCTCSPANNILDVLMKVEAIDFEAAKLRVADMIDRRDLIRIKGDNSARPRAADVESLLNPPADVRDDSLPARYLASRLGVDLGDVPLPVTPMAGWEALAYYDPPANGQGKPVLVGQFPCVIFATSRADGKRHAHRIYVAPEGAGKADLGARADGSRRAVKKSAKVVGNDSTAGSAVLWGAPEIAPHFISCEGVETGAALALALKNKIVAGAVAVVAATSASGIPAIRPWPETKHVTVAADRDEAKPPSDRGFKRGEQAARNFAQKHHENIVVDIALPGSPGESVDWLDIFRRDGIQAVVNGVASAKRFNPTNNKSDDGNDALTAAKAVVIDLTERAKADKGAPFEPDALKALSVIRVHDQANFQRLRDNLKNAGVSMRDLNKEVQKYGYRVIQGGAAGGDGATERAGPYKVINRAICYEKDTKEGPVTLPLCNFDVRIIGEEVRDDGAEQVNVFAVEGALQDGRPLPKAEVSADRYPAMNWVTTTWGTAPVIYAGQGTKDHLRVAIQLLSGDVPKNLVFSHLGWRKLRGDWVYLHGDGAIGPLGPDPTVMVQTGDSPLACYSLPDPPSGDELKTAIRASLSMLNLAPAKITYPMLAAVYRAPLGEAAPLDFSIFLVGPTGAQKTEITAIAQAHHGAEFNGRCLPGNWATTANSLEKQSFLAKDAMFTVDDFSPTGTTADVQRLHRDADRLLRSQGNRAGRGRMRPDGSLRPTYFPRGIIVSSGEDIPRGQSLRSRNLILEVSRGEVDLDRLTTAQNASAKGLLAQAMAAYVSWLAPQIDRLKARMPERLRKLRADARTLPIYHDRTPDIIASLAAGWEVFLDFAIEVEAIADSERGSHWEKCWQALLEAAEAQTGYQANEEPASRFLTLLSSAIASGLAYVADSKTNSEPKGATDWGWRRRRFASGTVEREELQPNGLLVGWLDGDDLLLDPDTAFAVAQRLARDQGSSLTVTAQTLWKRMVEQGMIVSRDDNRRRNTIRKVVGGRRRTVIHTCLDVILSKSGPSGPISPEPRGSAALGAEKMGHIPGPDEKVAHESGPKPEENSGAGPVGPLGPQIESKSQPRDEKIADEADARISSNSSRWRTRL